MHRLAAFLLAALPACALADTGYYLVSTYPNEGERSIDFKYWDAKPSGVAPRSAPEIGFGYNVNGRWYTEVGGAWFDCSCGGGRVFTGYTWQNDIMLTIGQYAIDVALHTDIVRMKDTSKGYAVEWGPVMQTEIGRTQFNFNFFFERVIRAVKQGPLELTYQAQVKYRWMPKLEFGVQAFGEVGPWHDWLPSNQQSHRIGPAVFGQWDLGGKQAWKYEAAYLVGKNSARTAKSLTARIQYVF